MPLPPSEDRHHLLNPLHARFPKPLEFSASDPAHAQLAQAAAILKAQVHGIPIPAWATDVGRVAAIAAATPIEPFVAKEGVKIETDPKASSVAHAMGSDEAVSGPGSWGRACMWSQA